MESRVSPLVLMVFTIWGAAARVRAHTVDFGCTVRGSSITRDIEFAVPAEESAYPTPSGLCFCPSLKGVLLWLYRVSTDVSGETDFLGVVGSVTRETCRGVGPLCDVEGNVVSSLVF